MIEGTIQIGPWLQTQNKKKNGWIKGRRCTIGDLEPNTVVLTETDIQVRQMFSATPDPTAAALLLAEQNNVMFEGQPVLIVRAEPLFEYRRSGNFYSIRPTGWKQKDKMFLADSGALWLSPQADSQPIRVLELTPEQCDIAHAMMQVERLPAGQFEEAMRQRLVQLQSTISILLPKEIAGQKRDEVVLPVMLLRARTDGQLDYGFRLRDAEGTLHRPACGGLVRNEIIQGKSVQWIRSANGERKL
jgi:hypothetical protein